MESRLDLPVHALMLAYLSRGGVVSLSRLAETDPDLVTTALKELGFCEGDPRTETLLDDVVQTPWPLVDPKTSTRQLAGNDHLKTWDAQVDISDPWGPEALAAVDHLVASAPAGIDAVVLTGEARRPQVLDRLAFAEHLRSRAPWGVAVEAGASCREDLIDGLVARRIDLFRLTSDPSDSSISNNSTKGKQ